MRRLTIRVDRTTVEEGRTFSAEALTEALDRMCRFVGESVQERWEETGEPPTHLEVVVEVTAA